jgi:hypothetical protein
MKIIYGLLSDDSGEHYCYKPEILKTWLVKSIKQCHILNPENEIIILTDKLHLRKFLPFAKFFNVNDYMNENIIWFKKNYIHLSTNQYNFEKNAILRYLFLGSFCKNHNIDDFLHLEPDVLVYSNVEEDGQFFKDYDVTFLHGKAAGCSFFKNAINVFNDFFTYIKNSYSVPQIEPSGFNMEEEKKRYEHHINNKIPQGGVSDMHFWSLYRYLHPNTSFEQMDQNINGIFYQTCMIDQKKNGLWKTKIEVIDHVSPTLIKDLEIFDNKCYGVHDKERVKIKYLHCHGHTKLFIPKYCIIK